MMTTYDVFLSHASTNKPEVEALARRLREDGLVPFLDKWHLAPGKPWQEALENALRMSRTCAVFVGSGEGPWQHLEMRAALSRLVNDKTFRVIPVLLPGAPTLAELPAFLNQLGAVECRDGLDDNAYHRLVCGIRDVPPGDSERPAPNYPDDDTRDLSRKLKTAYRRRAELEAEPETDDEAGAEVTELILDLRRKIREGGQLKAGDVLLEGRFELLETIGSGGFARVWKAYDESRRVIVAVKVLHSQYVQDQTRRERFFRGARHMAQLRHPGMVRVIEQQCEDGGYYFFVMEYIGGGDLRQAVKADRFSQQEKLRILSEVGEALGFAHESGLVHRDVKPGNILLDKDGHARLTDFDLVRAADTTGGTRTTGLGSFLYAAPEAMMDAKEATASADVYGLGMTAMFTFHGADLPPIVQRDPEGFAASLAVSTVCREALRRSVAFNPEDRWPTVESLCQALRGGFPMRCQRSKTSDSEGAEEPPSWAVAAGCDDQGRWAEFEIEGVLQRLRFMRPGNFQMGSPEDEAGRWDDEGPQHQVTLTRGFWLADTPCTQEFWQAVTGQNPSQFQSPRRPVEQVSWEDCQEFLQRINQMIPGLEARFPTEAQWEYACRAGTKTGTWVGNLEILEDNNAPRLDEIAWYGGNSDGTRDVGLKSLNPWGLYDMLGNVWEWCTDWQSTYSDSTVIDPTGPSTGTKRVIRGGSWEGVARIGRAASRYWNLPGRRDSRVGFRLSRGQDQGGEGA